MNANGEPGADVATLELLIGAPAFWTRAADDIARAQKRVLVQAMTFEGDAAGRSVADTIAAAAATDRRVLVDDYSRWVVSDRWVAGRRDRLPAPLREEVEATQAMFAGLIGAGAGVRRTNPIGRMLTNYPARNHKKLIVADDAAYIGGINFSDHNFAWHDFMLRLESALAADWLAEDFDATWRGRPRATRAELPGVTLWSLDGRANARAFEHLKTMIEAAREEIVVISPYLTFPVTGALARAARRGVRIRLITPWENNKVTVRDHLLATAADAGFEITLLKEMIHLKGLLIDHKSLVVGSSNFDFVSLAAEEELMAVVEDPSIIADFEARIVGPAIQNALTGAGRRVSRARGWMATAALRIAQGVAMSARSARRTAVEWDA
jgi:cardiolipin synthase